MATIRELKSTIRKIKRQVGKAQSIPGLTDKQWGYLAEAQRLGRDALKTKLRNGSKNQTKRV